MQNIIVGYVAIYESIHVDFINQTEIRSIWLQNILNIKGREFFVYPVYNVYSCDVLYTFSQ